MLLTTWLIPDIIAVASLIIVGLYFYYKLYLFKFWHKKGIFYIKPSFPTGNIMPIITGKTSFGKHILIILLKINILFKHILFKFKNLLLFYFI